MFKALATARNADLAPDSIAPALRRRLDGISDHVSLVNNRAPDPLHLAEVVGALV